ncbi:DNA replication complex GINS protein PSF2 [Metschnikowia bicuspidata var. bicuspidata NRRL YB-4993]|uniref:DNA replication complex GINS protein PSF2 n=1 Tax=Metschnikowia bicuspidata var. bicuspidata NRRL YB-4993 TaxID=869754 RepID=A0A1A0H9K0_9ASCO|nr:DNA replication complex GINS protein PSF2 [Metschnikowia bicuspidata var. bicuspidata NRRL YB-4993]OBA20553.1 DNA replication complex GINS protein PSF2 [Metschnikowia bicuspidata var. bicuspidata NRRL YB-4993]
MVLIENLRQNLSPAEIQFLCENEMISILPRYSMPKLDLIADRVPQLKGMKRVEVPLWIALILKGQGKCNIIIPDWLNHDHLSEIYEQERKFPHMFSKLPWNWIELAKIMLTKAADDLQDSSTYLRSILQDLKELRQLKSKRGLRELNESNIQLNGLSLMEINEMRPFVLGVMGKLRELHESTTVEEGEGEGSDFE